MDIGRVGTNLRIETVSHVFLSCIFVANSTKKIFVKSIIVGKIQGAKDNLTKMYHKSTFCRFSKTLFDIFKIEIILDCTLGLEVFRWYIRMLTILVANIYYENCFVHTNGHPQLLC